MSIYCIFNPYANSLLVSNAFPSPFLCLAVFRSSFVFLCHWIYFGFFLYDRSICTLSFDRPFLTLGKFQVWDWLWYPLACGPKHRVGVHMEQKSLSKFLVWPGFEPRTSHLAVQHATARPQCTPHIKTYTFQFISLQDPLCICVV